MLIRRDKVVTRFEQCRAQFSDVSSLWLAAESSVQLLGHAATLSTGSAVESGIGQSASLDSLPPTHSPRLSNLSSSARDTGFDTSTLVQIGTESGDSCESPDVRLRRLERLKDHLAKYIHRFKPDQLDAHLQCTCETERW